MFTLLLSVLQIIIRVRNLTQKGEYMRFDSEAYSKAFPRKEPQERVETVVDTFRPTQSSEEAEVDEPIDVEVVEDGNGSVGELDSE